MNKRKKVFMFVLSILLVILIITTPIFLFYKNEEERKQFEENSLKALQIIKEDSVDRNVSTRYIYTIIAGKIQAGRDEVQTISNLNGTITFDDDLKIEYAIHNKKWCIQKSKAMKDYKITKYNGNCEIMKSELELASEKCFEFSNGQITNYYENEENNSENTICPKKLIIPDTIRGEKVTSIGENAFLEKKLTEVTIPDSITSIEKNAFKENALVNLTIGKNVSSIGEEAFWNNRIENLVIPDNVKEIKSFAFAYNLISSLSIGNGLDIIGKFAFGGNQLENLVIPNNVKTIGENAFGLNNLKSVKLGTGITTIETGAFLKTEIVVGEGEKAIVDKSNIELLTIENKSKNVFDFGSIINGTSGYNFSTGTVINTFGNVEIK